LLQDIWIVLMGNKYQNVMTIHRSLLCFHVFFSVILSASVVQ
jgi:hypothetical protein